MRHASCQLRSWLIFDVGQINMKKILLYVLIAVVACAAGFYGGFRVGEFNGRIEVSAKNTGPLMNLLLLQTKMEEEQMEMNREQLYGNLDFYDVLRSSRLVTSENKRWLEESILLAKDYWQAAGGTVLQTEEAAMQTRKAVEEIKAATGVPMGMILNGVKVSPFLFEEQDRRVRELFARYSDKNSTLHEMIVEMVEKAKKESPTPK
jgi:hypothetical protein